MPCTAGRSIAALAIAMHCGCSREKILTLPVDFSIKADTGAPLPPPSPLAASVPINFTWPRYVTAFDLVNAYAKNPVAAERDYDGKKYEVLGIVDAILRSEEGGIVVHLRAGKSRERKAMGDAARHMRMLNDATSGYVSRMQRETLRSISQEMRDHGESDDRLLTCFFRPDAVAPLADVDVGQLVAVRGKVLPPADGTDLPSVDGADLSWVGYRTTISTPRAQMDRDTLLAAQSAHTCLLNTFNLYVQLAEENRVGEVHSDNWLGNMMVEDYAAYQKAITAGADGKNTILGRVKPEHEKLRDMLHASRATLEAMGTPALSCPHPLMFLLFTCDKSTDGACTTQVKAAATAQEKVSATTRAK